MSKIPAINEIDANSPSQESKEVVIKATDVSPDVNEIQETISGAATIQEVDGTRKPTISEIYKIVTDGLFESTSNWWDYAYKLSQAQINQDIIARLDRGEIGGGYSKGVDIITTTSNKVPNNTNVYSALKSDTLYPKKLNDETINGIYNFINGITIGKPTAYTGGIWSIDQLGKTHLTTDYLYVRLKAIFETLQILNVDTIGGKLVISPAGSINIVYVDNIKVTIDGNEQNVYRCYFLGEQEGEEIENKWKVGDQAQAKSFNVKKGTYHKTGNHYLWRLVVGVSTDTVTIDGKKYHYIDLSQLISDVGSDAPAPGDVLNQLGHRGDDLQRQTAIVLNAVDNYAPSITLYAGINDFTLLNKEYVEYGVYQGKAFFNVYGDMYIGDKGANPTTYIKYKNGKIDIKANLSIGSSIDGKDLDKYIKEHGGVDEETVKNLINNSQVIKDLQNQADGAIETWFYKGEPTLKNLPAVDWTTNEIKKIHVGDLYYDQITGFAYRFTRYNDDVNPYAWNRIKDNDIVQALETANNAQITADGKMKIFYNTKPTDYQVGDVWILPDDSIINGVQYYKGDILTATVKSTEFNEKHWTKKVRYIGSKELNDNIDEVNKKINDISATTLPGLNDKFNEFAKDGVIDSSEKARLTDLLNQANNEVLSVNEQITNIIKSDYLTNDNINKDKLIKAQKTLSTAWTEYKTLIDTLIVSTNPITKNNIAEASSKYTNLQNSIKAVKQYLAACQADILSNIGVDISSYKYLKEAFKGKTEVNGGLVVTNVLQLRQTSDVNSPITAGISGLQGKADENGVVDKDTYDITSIAAWFGGPMVDKDIFTDEQLNNKVAGTDYARSLFRHDGSGYLASGTIYWGTDGILHGNPNSFILQGTSFATMFNYVRLFYLHYANTNDEGITGVDYITPTKSFSRLDILTQGGTEAGLNLPTGLFIGSSTTGGSFQVGNVIIRTKDEDPNILEIVSATDDKTAHLGVQGGVSAYGTYTSSTGGGGGLNATVVSYANIIAGNYNDTDLTSVPNAYSIKALYNAIQNIDVTSQLGSYLLKTDAATMYQPKGNYLTAHQSLDGYVNAISVSGSGNAITSVSKSGKGITFTKGATFLTSHQSLANYYTKSSVDSLLSGKSATSHTHSVKINGVTKTIAATGGTAVDLGTYLTSHQDVSVLTMANDRYYTAGQWGINMRNSDIIGVNSIYTNNVSETPCEAILFCRSNGNYDGIRAVNGVLYFSDNVVRTTGNYNAEYKVYHTGNLTKLSQLTNDKNFVTGSVSGQTITINGVSTTWQNTWREITDSYSGTSTGTSLSQKGANSLYNALHNGYAISAGNADTVDGYHANCGNAAPYGHIPTIENDGVMEIGKCIDFHNDNSGKYDFSTRLQTTGNYGNSVYLPSHNGTLALISDNVASATKLATARSIWGQSFDGTGNVNGTIYINNHDSSNGAIRLNNDISSNARISAIKDQVIFNTGNAIRFGETAWKWNQWAGLKYTHSNKTIYLGIADGSVFNANSTQSDGTLRLAGITTITPDSGARIGGSGGDLYLGNADNSNWVKVQDICSHNGSDYWYIYQSGNAHFKNIDSGTATINGNLLVSGLIDNKGIIPASSGFNAKGTSCYVSADALCSGITAITDSIQVNQVTVQYSNDNGNSWTDYPMTNDAKFNLYANNAGIHQLFLGYDVITGNNDAEKLAQVKKNELIVSFYISNSCYTQPYFASVDVSNGIDTICTVEILNNSGAVVETYTKHMTGWNQLNYINLSNGNTAQPVGNDSRRYIRFRFKHDKNTTALRDSVINKIRIFSFTKYSFPTDRFMGHTGHIYNFDYNMNTYFPNSILAKGGVTAYQSSDIRLKQDLRKLDYLGIIKAMGGTFGFAWKKDNTRSIGWIAQHVLCNPHLKDIVETDEKGYYKINYWSPKLIATAFGAIEQVDDEVSRLKARVVFLESEVQRLSGDKEDCNKKRLDNKNINSLN